MRFKDTDRRNAAAPAASYFRVAWPALMPNIVGPPMEKLREHGALAREVDASSEVAYPVRALHLSRGDT